MICAIHLSRLLNHVLKFVQFHAKKLCKPVYLNVSFVNEQQRFIEMILEVSYSSIFTSFSLQFIPCINSKCFLFVFICSEYFKLSTKFYKYNFVWRNNFYNLKVFFLLFLYSTLKSLQFILHIAKVFAQVFFTCFTYYYVLCNYIYTFLFHN